MIQCFQRSKVAANVPVMLSGGRIRCRWMITCHNNRHHHHCSFPSSFPRRWSFPDNQFFSSLLRTSRRIASVPRPYRQQRLLTYQQVQSKRSPRCTIRLSNPQPGQQRQRRSSSSVPTRRPNQDQNHNNNTHNGRIPPYIWYTLGGSTAVVVWIGYAGMDRVPFTGRRRWIFMTITPEWEQQLGDAEYQTLLKYYQAKKKQQRRKEHILPSTHRASVTVQRVGNRLAQAVKEAIEQEEQKQSFNTPNQEQQQEQQKKNIQQKKDRPYTYTVVRSDDVANAFVLPGNHVFVMTGLFRYIHNEDELAAVLSHEMAHNVARHAGERLSRHFVTLWLLQLAYLLDSSGVWAFYFLPTLSALLTELPNSRQQETEADELGLYFAARACYDPRAAPRVFANMMTNDQNNNGNDNSNSNNNDTTTKKHSFQPPEFLSTHPSHTHRIANFEKWMPKALELYNNNQNCSRVRQAMEQARRWAAYQAMQREAAAKATTTRPPQQSQ